jgi:hypothetical protein
MVVLVSLGVRVYNTYLGNSNELKQAEYSLNNLIIKIEAMSEIKNSDETLIVNPNQWAVVTWQSITSQTLPKGCENGKDCICLCDFTSFSNAPTENILERENYLKSCNEKKKAICKSLNKLIFKEDIFWIDENLNLKLDFEDNKIKITKE